MKLTRKRVLWGVSIIGIIVILGGLSWLANRPPYPFMGQATLWFVQQSPNDSSETWAFYRSDTPFIDVFQAAQKALGQPSAMPVYEPCEPGTKGVEHFSEGGRDFYIAPAAANFYDGKNDILIAKDGQQRLVAEAFDKTMPRWPEGSALIVVKRRSSVPDRLRGWMTGLLWRGMSSESGRSLFRSGSPPLPPGTLDASWLNAAPGGTAGGVVSPSTLAAQILVALETGKFNSFSLCVQRGFFDRAGISPDDAPKLFRYLHSSFRRGADSAGDPQVTTTIDASSREGKAIGHFDVRGKEFDIAIVVRQQPEGQGDLSVDLFRLLVDAWRIQAVYRDIEKPFPQDVIEVAKQDMTALATESGLTKFPGEKPGTWLTWPDKLEWLSKQTEATFAK